MARTSTALVGGVIEADADFPVQPAIDAASLLVDRHCSGVPVPGKESTDSDYYLSATELEMVERWVAAHLYSVMIGRASSEQAGKVQEAKQYKLGLNFAVTMYGQQAMLLDATGGLVAANKGIEEENVDVADLSWAASPINPTGGTY